MRLFDVYVAVDWSARSAPSPARPSRDAIWVGERLAGDLGDLEMPAERYWRTRQACVDHLRDRLLRHVAAKRRIVLAFDFAYGYPRGYVAALDLKGNEPPWRLVWNELRRLVVDRDNNDNNRFAVASTLNARCGSTGPGPLWGCPTGVNLPNLLPTSPGYPYRARNGLSLERLRWVDRRLPGIQPVWKLHGTGSVGGQTILGIPTVCRLRDDPQLAAVSRVWPFETGFSPRPIPQEGPFVLHVEIWPGIVRKILDPTLPIRDQAQVRAVVSWLASLDEAGQLGLLFEAPRDLSTEALAACVSEEGWIFGASTLHGLRPSYTGRGGDSRGDKRLGPRTIRKISQRA